MPSLPLPGRFSMLLTYVGGVNGPIRIAALEKDKNGKYRARLVEQEELEEHQQNIKDAYSALKDFRTRQRADASETPELPTP